MNNKIYSKHFLKNLIYITKFIALLLLGLFLILLVVNNQDIQTFHFGVYDILIILFIPIIYLVGVFVRFKYEFINGIVIFISYIGYNIINIIKYQENNLAHDSAYILIPAILFMVVHIIKRYEHTRLEELDLLYGDYEELNQNYKIIEIMHQITSEMLQDNDLDMIFQSILEKAVEIIPKAQTGSILIKDKDQMVFRAAVGYDIESLKKVKLKFIDMYQYKLGNLYEPTVIRDIRTFNKSNLNEQQNKDLDERDALIAKSVLTCAITFRDEIYGFINLDNVEDEEAFQEKDKIFIKHLAQQVEVAVKNQSLVNDIYKLSRYDALTGAYTRTYHTTLLKEIHKLASQNHSVYSICNLDINELKPVNDHYGHEAGDAYIIHFSEVILKHLDEQDMFSRMGGDEFIVVYKDCDKKCSEERIKEIRKQFKKHPFIYENEEIQLTFGCGIATFMEDSVDLEKLLTVADQRMYLNKKEMRKK